VVSDREEGGAMRARGPRFLSRPADRTHSPLGDEAEVHGGPVHDESRAQQVAGGRAGRVPGPTLCAILLSSRHECEPWWAYPTPRQRGVSRQARGYELSGSRSKPRRLQTSVTTL
jgi:hypothetical protein